MQSSRLPLHKECAWDIPFHFGTVPMCMLRGYTRFHSEDVWMENVHSPSQPNSCPNMQTLNHHIDVRTMLPFPAFFLLLYNLYFFLCHTAIIVHGYNILYIVHLEWHLSLFYGSIMGYNKIKILNNAKTQDFNNNVYKENVGNSAFG